MQKDVGDNIYLLVIMCTVGIALLVISFVILFIRNQNKLLKQRENSHQTAMDHQKNLLHAVIHSQEEERKRIGQDLHDEVGGSLSNLRMLINRLDNHIGAESSEPKGGIYKQLIDKIIDDVRNISHNLSPPGLELFGFSEALEDLKATISKGQDSLISITNHAVVATDALPKHVALALIRVLQELVTNTLKHAKANYIGISLFMKNDLLSIHYSDNGIGFDIEDKRLKKGMGMQNIESRLMMINARYSVKTTVGKGFSMFIYIDPVKDIGPN
ncbi:sensor histidine kinase [Mucilaginibacter sp. FT3.2]|uniref:sensor histidine kinase n=1 Tax=Mucilaginibacter sp. FT3.2 TaxID=2723090 RepID=UPI001608E65F|nr:histidine kinase [Mucilaginibacter sp. FT3.2]MBB6232353.1 signal transduction histidine kinase [Mucilaginibacter sp. FT3.2]